PYVHPVLRALPVWMAYAEVSATRRLAMEIDESLYPYVGEGFYSYTMPAVTEPLEAAELLSNTPARALAERLLAKAGDWLDLAKAAPHELAEAIAESRTMRDKLLAQLLPEVA